MSRRGRRLTRVDLIVRRMNHFCYLAEVLDNPFHLLVPGLIIPGAEDGGRVDCRQDIRRQRRVDKLAVLLADAELFSQ